MSSNRPGAVAGNDDAPALCSPVSFRRIALDGVPRNPSRRLRVLARLLQRPHNSFELATICQDDNPGSTIAGLRGDGLNITADFVHVPRFGGALTRIARYSLADESRERAQQMIQAG